MTSDVCTTLGLLDPLLPCYVCIWTPPPFSVDVKVWFLRNYLSLFGQLLRSGRVALKWIRDNLTCVNSTTWAEAHKRYLFPTFVLSPGTVFLGLDVGNRLPDCRRPEPRDSEAIRRVSLTGRSPITHSQDMHGILPPYPDSIAQPNRYEDNFVSDINR